MNLDDTETSPTLWQRRAGLLGIVLMLPLASVLIAAGRSSYDLTHALRTPELILPLTPVIESISGLLMNFWYIAAVGMIAFYWLWMSKTRSRLIWCNAVLAIVVPLMMFVFIYAAIEQQMVIEEALRKR